MWVAIAIALAVALGLFRSESSGIEAPRIHQGDAWVRSDGTIVVRVLGPVLY